MSKVVCALGVNGWLRRASAVTEKSKGGWANRAGRCFTLKAAMHSFLSNVTGAIRKVADVFSEPEETPREKLRRKW